MPKETKIKNKIKKTMRLIALTQNNNMLSNRAEQTATQAIKTLQCVLAHNDFDNYENSQVSMLVPVWNKTAIKLLGAKS
ncbi:hypothetical protein LCGC14_0432510 [marine sediment metagenome]|uniref:Uncharacterized protein n=1 Tax=marine sediment metagenome TaxID=412755 RepID=A0A0F9T5K8_9ZZZZ